MLDFKKGRKTIKLGRRPDRGEVPQAVVGAGKWFAAEPAKGTDYSLVGCTVAPGFDFFDFEIASRQELMRLYSTHKNIIQKLTLP
jgi:predicted cupin superfamily sugar epimerase